ncbi:putative ankyrin-2-like [Capsicum annuum]|nr:putative ankyrin-2-like [Capsicum annuum]
MFGGNENVGSFMQHLMRPQLPHHLSPHGSISIAAGGGSSSASGRSSSVGDRLGRDDEFATRDGRVPPWSNQEIRDFIAIRGELQIEFSSTKRSNLKNLWEIVGVWMNERGYRRSGEQCKIKWKNLITRYKDIPPERCTDCQLWHTLYPITEVHEESPNSSSPSPNLTLQNVKFRDTGSSLGDVHTLWRSKLHFVQSISGTMAPGDETQLTTGGSDLEGYLKWESQCDRIFQDNALDDVKKTTYDVAQFEGYALNWWESAKRIHGVLHAGHYPSWQAMKAIMASNEGHHED